jgi:hypothetical protein
VIHCGLILLKKTAKKDSKMKYKVIITNKIYNIIEEQEFVNRIDAVKFFQQFNEIENSQEVDNEIATSFESKREFLTVTSYFIDNEQLFPIAVKYCKVEN